MSSLPSIETVSVIAGIGGWAGTYYAAGLYLDGTQLTRSKLLTLLSLPLLWSSMGVVVVAGGAFTLNATLFMYSAMLKPVPLAINLLALIGLTSWMVISKNIQCMIYRTVAEEAEHEQRIELRIPPSPPNEADDTATETVDEEDEEEEGDEEEEEEEEEGDLVVGAEDLEVDAEADTTEDDSSAESDAEQDVSESATLPAPTEATQTEAVAESTEAVAEVLAVAESTEAVPVAEVPQEPAEDAPVVVDE
jgi:hypothetical protein